MCSLACKDVSPPISKRLSTPLGIQLHHNGKELNLTLYNWPGIEFEANKGDLWGFSLPNCITLHEITGVSVVANGDDGWNIKSIVTWVQDSNITIQLLMEDFDVYRWVDGDDNSDHLCFRLTLSKSYIRSGIIILCSHSYSFADTTSVIVNFIIKLIIIIML